MNKFNIIASVLLVLIAAQALAVATITYDFNINNVDSIAYDCMDGACNTVNAFSGSYPNGPSTTNGFLDVRYPTQIAVPNGYAIYYVSPGYLPMEYRATWHGTGAATFNIDFVKAPVCSAAIDTFTVTNQAYENVPLVIDMSASLDAITRSAFELTETGVGYVPPALQQQYYSVDTRVTLTIFDANNNVVNAQNVDFTAANGNAIFAGENRPVQFIWTPTVTGTYRAVVTTDILDNQCASTLQQSSTASFDVLGGLPRNSCYTILGGLAADPFVGTTSQEVDLSFTKISNHANDFPFNNGNYQLTPIPTTITYTVNGPTGQVAQQTFSAPANGDNTNPSTQQFSFTPPAAGMYTVSVTGTGSSNLCNGLSNPSTTVTLDVRVDDPGQFTIHFQIVDAVSGAPIQGATIQVGGQTLTTDATGQATTTPMNPGLYTYIVSAPGYVSLSGSANLVDVNLDIFLALRRDTNGGTGRVTFEVRNGLTQAPIAGSTVTFRGMIGTTDASGIVSWNNQPAGNHAWNVAATGFQPASGNVVTDGVTDEYVIVTLLPDGIGAHDLSFHVFNSQTSANIPGAMLTVTGNGLPPNGITGTTNVAGLVTFQNLLPGTYSWLATAAGFTSANGGATILNQDVLVQVPLDPIGICTVTHAVTFTVLDDTNSQPIAGATVTVGTQTGTTNAQGVVVFQLCDGTYSYTVSAPGYNAFNGIVTVAGQDVSIVVRLTRNGGGPQPQPEPEAARLGIFVGSIRIPEMQVGDGEVPILITLENDGDDDLEGVRITAVSAELGLRAVLGPFDLDENEDKTFRVILHTEDVALETGLYPIRLTISNDDTRRVVYRDLEVLP